MGGPMLQRLNRSDRMTELLAVLEIGERPSERLLAQSGQLGGNSRAADIERPFKQRPAMIDLADDGVGVDLGAIEADARRIVGVDHDRPLDLDSLGLRVHKKERETV